MIFIRELKNLKNCTLMGSFCPKHIMFQLENFRRIMTLKGDAKFRGKLTFGLKNNIRNSWEQSKVWKFALWSDSFVQSKWRFRSKNTEELYFMTTKNDAKFEQKLTLGSKTDMRNLVSFQPTTQKSKNFTSISYFCPKYIKFELRRVIFHDTEQWCKIE